MWGWVRLGMGWVGLGCVGGQAVWAGVRYGLG